MKYRDELCNSGYLHGIIESKFSQSEDVFADMKAMCGRYEPGRYMSWQCYHGIGHGAMFYTSNDLPRSLEMCDGFEDEFERSSCANGVFMENFNTEQRPTSPSTWRRAIPSTPARNRPSATGRTAISTPPPIFSTPKGTTTPLPSSGVRARRPASRRRAPTGSGARP
jgi:hypothetical protein